MTRNFFAMFPRPSAFQCRRKGGGNCITLIKCGHRPHQARVTYLRFDSQLRRLVRECCLILDKLEKNYPEAMHRDYKRTELRAIKGIQGKFQALSIPLYRAGPPGREFMDMFRIIAGGLLGKRRVSRSVYARDQVSFRQESSKHSKAHPTIPGLHRASEQSVQSRSVTISN